MNQQELVQLALDTLNKVLALGASVDLSVTQDTWTLQVHFPDPPAPQPTPTP
jgi:hypothetical protein